ncbi:hypothetical protein [Streptomyces sp. NPDC059008]|uniref:hypothetical protein n=1 Tax=Streptomyces sp. NPDC059008 TaxID=3346693 RepID=UPI00368552EB
MTLRTLARKAALIAVPLLGLTTLSPTADAHPVTPKAAASRYTLSVLNPAGAPIYEKPSSSSRKLAHLRQGTEVVIICQLVKGTRLWYSLETLRPGGEFVWSGHFMSPARPPRSC